MILALRDCGIGARAKSLGPKVLGPNLGPAVEALELKVRGGELRDEAVTADLISLVRVEGLGLRGGGLKGYCRCRKSRKPARLPGQHRP